jgi:sensor histidine kinase regulating citrate/malate metabolism
MESPLFHFKKLSSIYTNQIHSSNSTMSQWLTSGRNRLLEKQQQKQRFGSSATLGLNHHPPIADQVASIEGVLPVGCRRAAVTSGARVKKFKVVVVFFLGVLVRLLESYFPFRQSSAFFFSLAASRCS